MGKKKQSTGLGKAIIRDRFGKRDRKSADNFLHTSELNDGYDWGRLNLQSVTEQSNLDEFLATAELAGTEFTAEKLNIKFVSKDSGLLPHPDEVKAIKGLHKQHENLLRIPRRPPWTKQMSASEVDQNERAAFLDWRRSLASLQEDERIIMTPYEKNLDFWRQLWRVIERSDIVVQIVDARNPLLFYCQDLEDYVKEVDSNKMCMVLVNKADFLNQEQREIWADYFTERGIRVAFWSAVEESKRQEELSRTDGESDAQNDLELDHEDTGDSDEEGYDDDDKDLSNSCDDRVQDNIIGASADVTVDGKETLHESQLLKKSTESENLELKTIRDEEDKVLNQTEDTVCTEPEAFKAEPDTGRESTGGGRCSAKTDDIITQTDDSAGDSVDKSTCTGDKSQDTCQKGENSHCTYCNQSSELMTKMQIKNLSKIYTGPELLDLFKCLHVSEKVHEGVTTIGMVGYPNVGKSSTINAILKMKKVPVSATPGRTKHFQTLYVDPTLMLCDCPGLVFPSFVTTKADLVINGILPIDQMRDFVSPTALVCQKIPRWMLESTYGINLPRPSEGEDPGRPPTAYELLNTYGAMRGFMTNNGLPDCPRSSRYILKDFVNGKLLYCHPPLDMDSIRFNGFLEKEPAIQTSDAGNQGPQSGAEPSALDSEFFRKEYSTVHTRSARGTSSGVSSTGSSQSSLKEKPWKKHNNRNKKEKLRRVYAHLDKQ